MLAVFGIGEYYGYLFRNETYRVNGKLYEVYYCSGNER